MKSSISRSGSRPSGIVVLAGTLGALAAGGCVRYGGTTEVTLTAARVKSDEKAELNSKAYLIPRYDWDEAGGVALLSAARLLEGYHQGMTPLTNNASDGAYVFVAECEEQPRCWKYVWIRLGESNWFECDCR